MNKKQFLQSLADKLSMLPQSEIQKSLEYYSEIIDDRMEDGMTEEEAVAALGDVQAIAREILLNTPLPTLIKAKATPRKKRQGWEILLLILGFPLWFPLLIAFFSIVFALYVALGSVILSLWAVVLCIPICALCALAGAVFLFFSGAGTAYGLAALGAFTFLSGFSIFLFFIVKALCKALLRMSAALFRAIKSLFIKKED